MNNFFTKLNASNKNKKISLLVISFLIFGVFFSQIYISQAAFNKQINYQARLTDSSFVAVPDGAYNMEFNLYTVSSGGSAIWTEDRIQANRVTVTNGNFSVMLGEITSIASVDFNQTLYLGVNIGDTTNTPTPTWDGEMTPRKKLGVVPASVLSESSISTSNLTGGNSTTLLGSIPYQSDVNVTTLLSPNTTATKKFFTMTGTGTNGAIPAWDIVTASDVGLGNVPNLSFSGSNTGDETLSTIKTKLGSASAGVDGYLLGTDWTIFNNKQTALVSATNIKTINGSSILGSGDLIVSGGGLSGSGTTNELTYWVNSTTFGALPVATYPSLTELSYVKGVTSSIQTQLGSKQDTLVSGTNIKTINGSSIVGSGDMVIGGGGGGDMYLANVQTITGAKTFGSAGDVGKLIIAGTTSGSVILDATPVASGTVTIPNGGTLVNSVTTANGVSALNTAGALSFTLGAITPTTTNGLTITANGTNTLNIAAGKSLIVSNSLTFTGTDSSTLNIGTGGTLGSNAYTSTAYLPLAGGTMVGNLLFTDNTYDIGASGATRPRTGYFGTSIFSPLLVGGIDVGSNIIYQSTTGAGTSTGIAHQFTGGTNGGTVIQTMLNNGNVGVGTTNPSSRFQVNGGELSLDEGQAISWRYAGQDAGWKTGYINTSGYKMDIVAHYGVDFKTNQGNSALTAMKITQGGNVSVGTNNSTAMFLVGQVTNPPGSVVLNGTTSVVGNSTQFTNNLKVGDTITVNGETRTIATITSDTALSTTIAFTSSGTYLAGDWLIAGGDRFSVMGNGNVGIGTTTPVTSLQVNENDVSITGAVLVGDGTNSSTAISINQRALFGYGGDMAVVQGLTSKGIQFNVNNATFGSGEAMRIASTGSVGIGTTNPTGKFEVRDTGGGVVSLIDSVVNISKYGYAENQYGVYNPAAGTPLKQLYSLGAEGTYSDGGVLTNNGFYLFDAAAGVNRMYVKNNGNIGIGTSTPTAVLHLKAGTATAGTAPLKLTSGTNLGTTEAGAIEYNGTHLYFTAVDAGARYQLDQQITSWDTIGDASGNGSIAMGSTVQTMDWGTATTTNPLSLTASALTTGKLLSVTSNTLTSGTLLDLISNGTGALTGQKGINIALSGANGTGAQTTYGASFSNTHTGTSNNVGLYATASGGTNNYAGIFDSGYVGIGTTAPTGKLDILSASDSVDADLLIRSGVSGSSTARSMIKFRESGAGAFDYGTDIGYEGVSDNFVIQTVSAGTPTTALTVQRATGYVGIGITNPSVALDVVGDIEYTGTITDVSDERLKENIIPITGALDIVLGIQGKYFNMKDTPNRIETGFIAQNVNEFVPSAVSIIDPAKGYMGVSYSALIPVSFEAIRELDLKVKDLSSLDTTTATSLGSLIKTFLADISNGIGDLYATVIHSTKSTTKNLCVTDDNGAETCITKSQLDALLTGSAGNAGGSNGGGGSVPPADFCPNVTGTQVEADGPCADTSCLAPNNWNTETQVCDTPAPASPQPPTVPTCEEDQTLVDNVCTNSSPIPLTCTAPQILNTTGDACEDPTT